MIGSLRTNGDGSDCVWRTYHPQIPLWEASFYDKGDTVGDYVPWRCSDDSQLDTIRQDEEHPHGFEPTNHGGGGDGWTIDGDGEGDGWDADGTTIIN